MGHNTGKPYEQLTQVLFQSILNQRQVRTIDVQHGVTLQGKRNNTHQIDVYWRFALDRWEYETIVQTKDWKEPVDQGELIKFHGVLNDLPGQPKGIFVSRSGYQQGAIDYAFQHGVLIYELREADVEPPLILETTGWAHYALIRMPLRGIIGTTKEIVPTICTQSISYMMFSHPGFRISSTKHQWLG